MGDLKANLTNEGREQTLLNFPAHMYKRIACVAVGDPTPEFKTFTQGIMLAEKQAASDKAFKIKQAEEKQRRNLAKRQKALEKEKKKQEKAKKKALDDMKKKIEEKKAAELKTAEGEPAEEKQEEKQ